MNRRHFLSKTAGAAERFAGDQEADKLLGRTSCAPYLLPENL